MQSVDPGPEPAPPDAASDADASSAELVREAISEARQLMRLEVALARNELKRELGAARSAAITLGVGAAVLLLAFSLLLVALSLAIFPGPLPALVIGLSLLAVAALCGVVGMRLFPRRPLGTTKRRLGADLAMMKRRIA